MTDETWHGEAGHELEPQTAIVDVLLAEALGGRAPRDLTDRVLARLAAEGTEAAAMRLRAAGGGDGEVAPRPASRASRPWLAAAVLLIGVGVLVAVSWSRRNQPPVPVQPPQQPASGDELPIRDLAQLRERLPQVTRIELEVQHLSHPAVAFSLDLSGTPVRAGEELEARIIAGLAQEARIDAPAGWKWPNRLTLVLRSGQRIAMAIDPHDEGERLRLGLRGLQGDLRLGGDGAAAIRTLLTTATRAARASRGVVSSAADLVGENAFPGSSEQLRLFGLPDDDLRHLERFAKLRGLDAAGLRGGLTARGLAAIGRCGSIEELSLAGLAVPDDGLAPLTGLRHLRRLDLRAVRDFTGSGFRHFTTSNFRPIAPIAVDLGDAKALTDAGLARLAEWGVPDLGLAGAGNGIGAAGWGALLASRSLVRLDLSRWALGTERLRDLANRPDLQELVLDDCAIDDAALEVLATTKGPLRKLSLRGNPAVTSKGLVPVIGIATLRGLDIRGLVGLDLEALSIAAFLQPDLVVLR